MKPLLLILLSILLSPVAGGQWSAAFRFGTLVDDNAFNNYLQVQDRVTEMALHGGYAWEMDQSEIQLQYDGSYNYFSLLPGRTFHTHTLGAAWSHNTGEDDATLLQAGGSTTLRQNREEYGLFDHLQFSLYGNVRTYISSVFMCRGGYSFSATTFAELGEFDFQEHALFVQGTTSLAAKTSVILQADLGFKEYQTANTLTVPGIAPSVGRGRGAATSTPGVTQLTGTLRIGQGIAEQTGLSLTAQYQVNLRKESRYLVFEDGVVTDDELFDDRYSYDGTMVALMLTQLLPADFRFRASGSIQKRLYNNRPAFDLLGVQVAAQREDTRSIFSLSLDTTFPSLGVKADLICDHIINASNDAYYHYRNDALSLRLSYGF
jgi:hypothetical protein